MASAIGRLQSISDQMSGGKFGILAKSDNDVVIVDAIRTAIGKGGKGAFKDTMPSDLLYGVLKALLARTGIEPHLVQDIAVGSVLPPGGGHTEFRAAAIAAGFPTSTAVKAVNRPCTSSLTATIDIIQSIQSGMIEIGIGAGVESMTKQYGPGAVTEFSELLESVEESANCKVPMGVLSEDMARDYKISRTAQDAWAAKSYQKAAAAQKADYFDTEIAPITVTRDEKQIVVSKDEGIRDGVTAESLGKIRPAFAKDGSIHAGNASQVSDGAAAVLLQCCS